MADTKISALPASTTPLAGSEVLPIVQSSATKQVSVANLTVGRSVSVADLTVSANNVVPSTAAKGMNFTANTPASGSGITSSSQLLNWYEEGLWTPVITFLTPGNLAITYNANVQKGTYTRIGNKVYLNFNVNTTSFTFTTASGALQVTGIPFTPRALTQSASFGSLQFGGITTVGYTQIAPRILNNYIDFIASGSGLAAVLITATETPSGGSLSLRGSITYDV
jgi:hypothetical protein